MANRLTIVDTNTGETLEHHEFTGGYNIQFAVNENDGRIQRILKLGNAKYDDKMWIKNYMYQPIAEKLVQKFVCLGHVNPRRILFLEDNEWEPKDSTKADARWIGKIKKAPKEMTNFMGYEYIMELREFYLKDMSSNQIVALIYHELKHIDTDGSIRKHDLEDWKEMVDTLGDDWAETMDEIADILQPGFSFAKKTRQTSMFEGLKVVR